MGALDDLLARYHAGGVPTGGTSALDALIANHSAPMKNPFLDDQGPTSNNPLSGYRARLNPGSATSSHAHIRRYNCPQGRCATRGDIC
jgi:hypothetical protein